MRGFLSRLARAPSPVEETRPEATQPEPSSDDSGKSIEATTGITTGDEDDSSSIHTILPSYTSQVSRPYSPTPTYHSTDDQQEGRSPSPIQQPGQASNTSDILDVKTPLNTATSENRAAISWLSENGTDMNTRDSERLTALHEAVANKSEKMVELLLNGGIDINAKNKFCGSTVLQMALYRETQRVHGFHLDEGAHIDAEYGSGPRGSNLGAEKCTLMSIIHLLLKSGATPTQGYGREFFLAAEAGDESLIKLLLDIGAQPDVKLCRNQETPLITAAKCGHRRIVEILLEHGATIDIKDDIRWTALEWATEKGHADIVELLIANGGLRHDSRRSGFALSLAAGNGYRPLSQLLINSGASLVGEDDLGRAALHVAAERGQEAIVRLLLDYGAGINDTDDFGETALIRSAKCGHTETVQLLLDKGADSNIADNIGWTSLNWAAMGGHEPALRLLLGHTDGRIAKEQEQGISPLWWARRNGHNQVVQLLESENSAPPAQQKTGSPRTSYDLAGWGSPGSILIPIQVNGRPLKAFISSGYCSSVITVACARECGIHRLIDNRWSGILRGVSTVTIFGKIHTVVVTIAGEEHMMSFNVICSDSAVEVVLGLDFLIQHQVLMDFSNNQLVLRSGQENAIPFFAVP